MDTSEQEIKEIEEVFNHLHHYRNVHQQYKNVRHTGVFLVWLFFLILSAILTRLVDLHEFYDITFLVIVAVLGLNLFPQINKKIISFYFNNINKNLGREISLYFKYYWIVSESMRDTLRDGSDGNLCQKVVLRSLSQLKD